MRLLVGVATAAIVHGLVFGLGLLLLPRQAVPAPAPAQVDVDVVAARPEPIDRRPAAAAPVAPSMQPHAPARRPQPRSQAVPGAVVTPEASSTVTLASARPSAGAIVASRAAAPRSRAT